MRFSQAVQQPNVITKNQIAREICYIEAPINRIYVWLVLQWAAWFHANGAACVLSSLYCMHTTTA